MSTPVVYGGLGIAGNGLGTLGLGGPQPVQSFALPTMPTKATPFIAHLYDSNLVFKRLLGKAFAKGGGGLLEASDLKQTQNGGFQSVTISLAASITEQLPALLLEDRSGKLLLESGQGAIDAEHDPYLIQLGDVIRLTQQGDTTNRILFSGNVESVPEPQAPGVGQVAHQIVVAPWVTELGDGYFDQTYATATDVAQFVRDAVATTGHCSVSPISCPNTGITAIYDFQNSSPLDAIHVAKQRAGAFYWWFCDEQGVVWFQPINPSNPPTITLHKGREVTKRTPLASIQGMKNKIPIVGGTNPGDNSRITSQYPIVGSEPTVSQQKYGVRTLQPSLSYPNVTDQGTLDGIAAALGQFFDRIIHTDEIELPALGQRFVLGRPGGITVRIFEPAQEALEESGEPYAGGYSTTLIVRDVATTGAKQVLKVGDVPFEDLDPAFEHALSIRRMIWSSGVVQPAPVLAPPAPAVTPTTTVTQGACRATTTGILAMGGGIVTVGSATFTVPVAGTCQVLGAIDARMEAWDNYIAAPRRAVRAILSSGIFTGAWQELPFGLTRATYDLSSASGIALAAGTYTLSIQVDTQEFNQIHVYSAWAQVAVTS